MSIVGDSAILILVKSISMAMLPGQSFQIFIVDLMTIDWSYTPSAWLGLGLGLG